MRRFRSFSPLAVAVVAGALVFGAGGCSTGGRPKLAPAPPFTTSGPSTTTTTTAPGSGVVIGTPSTDGTGGP